MAALLSVLFLTLGTIHAAGRFAAGSDAGWPVALRPRMLAPAKSRPSLRLPEALLNLRSILWALLTFNLNNALQTGLDLTYLWGGASLPTGMTPATYAHRGAYPVCMSALTWVMQLCFCLHIRCNNVEFQAIPKWGLDLPPEAVLWPLERLAHGVTMQDRAALRHDIVIPYMIAPPQNFDVVALARTLASNPITAALLERCPPEYSRFD